MVTYSADLYKKVEGLTKIKWNFTYCVQFWKNKILSKKCVDKTDWAWYNSLCKSGDDGVEETLLSIPNRTVKLYSADGTSRETVRESKTLPGETHLDL